MGLWDHSTHEKFYDYYAKESQSEEAIRRFRSIRECVLRFIRRTGRSGDTPLEVADIGCGAGTQSMLWADLGHKVHGLDVNKPLVELARERAKTAGYPVDFRVGSAAELPWVDGSMEVCLALELLEHIVEWRLCIAEFERILRPGGILFLTTTNRLCPVQSEFNLPLYSWYPASVKRRFETIAKTTNPSIANFATYPAVNWFTFYELRSWLGGRGFLCHDRFDVMDLDNKGNMAKAIVMLIRSFPEMRYLAHVASSGTMLLAIKDDRNAHKIKK